MTVRLAVPARSLHLAATCSAFGCAQREVRRLVADWGLGHIADVVELLALELVAVALGTGGRPVVQPRYRELRRVRLVILRFQLDSGVLVIATWDDDLRAPRFKQPGTGAETGVLYWVPMLADAWDFYRSGTGKVVWCEYAVPPSGGRQLPRRSRTCRVCEQVTRYFDNPAVLERVRVSLGQL